MEFVTKIKNDNTIKLEKGMIMAFTEHSVATVFLEDVRKNGGDAIITRENDNIIDIKIIVLPDNDLYYEKVI